jgi:hypothetical protein
LNQLASKLMLMNKFLIAALGISTFLILSVTTAEASLNSPINLENPRVVPIYGQQNSSQTVDRAGWSGYLYSSRIVFSAAHSHFRFDNAGNRILSEAPYITVGMPNSAASDKTGRVKVIKTFVGDYRSSSVGGLNDFIVYVLERDLVPISPGKLLTSEIEKELVAINSEVKLHGYGEYQDRCVPEETPPCKEDRNDPKKRTSELPRSPTGSMKLVPSSYFSWLSGVQLKDLANETLLSDNLACSGDSGGPVTALYKGEAIYLGTTPLGFTPGYYCGAGRSRVSEKPIGFFSPVYKHRDLIEAAENFINANSAPATNTSITCYKGKLTKKISSKNPKCPKGYKKK